LRNARGHAAKIVAIDDPIKSPVNSLLIFFYFL